MSSSVSTGRSFGEEGGLLTYGSYLRLPELLAQQVPQVVPPAHDELLFITTHQAYELWFQQLLHELTAVRDSDARGSGGSPAASTSCGGRGSCCGGRTSSSGCWSARSTCWRP